LAKGEFQSISMLAVC